ncbi:hypothetical protein [Phenylobacterium sp. J367]|uniref:hypothetical protein n=1 Tax=Phenylobacterium sp. J367 TaxID=2898435 RepID=UPI002150B552|nr:hypothetical protein [Phenylobacterium sp. J367]MCR5880544.1 hypothetical protein [Phenylobacterium sp. J367]
MVDARIEAARSTWPSAYWLRWPRSWGDDLAGERQIAVESQFAAAKHESRGVDARAVLVEQGALELHVAQDAGDAQDLAGQADALGRGAGVVVGEVELGRPAEQRGSGAQQVELAIVQRAQRNVGRGGRERQRRGQAIVDRSHGPQPAAADLHRRLRVGPAHEQQRLVLLDDPGLEGRLAPLQQAAADVDDPGVLAPLPARAVGDHADDVDALGEGHVEELVAALGRGVLAAAQDVVDVELHVVAQRQLAAQVDAVEDVRLVERDGGEVEAAAADAARTEGEARRVDVARADDAGLQRSEEAALDGAALEDEAGGVGFAGLVRAEVALEAGVEQVGADADVVAHREAVLRLLDAGAERDVEGREAEEAVGGLDLQDIVPGADVLHGVAAARHPLHPALDREELGRRDLERQGLGLDLELDRQQALERRGADVDLGVGGDDVGGGQRHIPRAVLGCARSKVDDQGAARLAQPADDPTLVGQDLDVHLEKSGKLADREEGVLRDVVGREAVGQGEVVELDGEQQQGRRIDDRRGGGRRGLGSFGRRARGRGDGLSGRALRRTENGKCGGGRPRDAPTTPVWQGVYPGKCRRR